MSSLLLNKSEEDKADSSLLSMESLSCGGGTPLGGWGTGISPKRPGAPARGCGGAGPTGGPGIPGAGTMPMPGIIGPIPGILAMPWKGPGPIANIGGGTIKFIPIGGRFGRLGIIPIPEAVSNHQQAFITPPLIILTHFSGVKGNCMINLRPIPKCAGGIGGGATSALESVSLGFPPLTAAASSAGSRREGIPSGGGG